MKITITSRYGEMESFRTHPHNGIDLNYPLGTNVNSVHSGVVEKVVDYVDNIGKGVIIKNDNGETSIYGHLNDIAVKEGQRVGEGSIIGHSGSTGHSTGNHLHYAEKIDGSFVDPTHHFNDLASINGNSTGNGVIDYFKGFKERGMSAENGGDYNFWGDSVFPFLANEGKEFAIECFNYLTLHLPEITGSLTLLAAALIMLGIKTHKVASIYGISLVVSAFWRMST
jgi:murein DD-endopeptidase MepM/ murein hydrolase activator NlpD